MSLLKNPWFWVAIAGTFIIGAVAGSWMNHFRMKADIRNAIKNKPAPVPVPVIDPSTATNAPAAASAAGAQ